MHTWQRCSADTTRKGLPAASPVGTFAVTALLKDADTDARCRKPFRQTAVEARLNPKRRQKQHAGLRITFWRVRTHRHRNTLGILDCRPVLHVRLSFIKLVSLVNGR